MGKGWTTILDHVVSFERSGKFLYASVLTDPNNIVSISDMHLVVRKPDFIPREQQRHSPACTSAESDECLCYCSLEIEDHT